MENFHVGLLGVNCLESIEILEKGFDFYIKSDGNFSNSSEVDIFLSIFNQLPMLSCLYGHVVASGIIDAQETGFS